MLLPYASDRPPKHPPLTVVLLVLVNFVIFGLFALGVSGRGANAAVALYANLSLVPGTLRPWSPVTYAFLHESAFHLSLNMAFLWVFGSSVEDALGWKRFLALYVISAAIAGMLQVGAALALPGGNALLPIVGASGAISTVVGVFAVRFYRSRIRFIGLPGRVPAILLLIAVLAGEMAATIWDVARAGGGGAGQATAHWAHIGGFLLGVAWAQATRQFEAGRREYMAGDARMLLEQGAPLAAVRRWEAVLEGQPDNLEAQGELARASAAAGDRRESVTAFRLAIMRMLHENRKPQAAALYRDMRAHFPDEHFPPAEQYALASTLEETGDYETAVAAFGVIPAVEPEAPEAEMALLRQGVIYQKRLGENEKSTAVLERFLRDYPASEWQSYADELLRSAREAGPPPA